MKQRYLAGKMNGPNEKGDGHQEEVTMDTLGKLFKANSLFVKPEVDWFLHFSLSWCMHWEEPPASQVPTMWPSMSWHWQLQNNRGWQCSISWVKFNLRRGLPGQFLSGITECCKQGESPVPWCSSPDLVYWWPEQAGQQKLRGEPLYTARGTSIALCHNA